MITLATDGYKLSHKGFEEPGTTKIFNTWIPRSDKYLGLTEELGYDGKVVVFGYKFFIEKFLVKKFNKFFKMKKSKAIRKMKKEVDSYLGEGKVDLSAFEALHDLGYLPLIIYTLHEGSVTTTGVPHMVSYNTVDGFEWLTNYIETLFSAECWKPTTVATISRAMRRMLDKFAMETVGNTDFVDYQAHDFSMRGQPGLWEAKKSGAGHLLFFKGTDTIPAIQALRKYYNAEGFLGTSIPASEHSIASLGYAVRGELESFRKWLTEDYPIGAVSLVSDTTDYWKVITEYTKELHDVIMSRGKDEIGLCKTVFRPDSGDPFRIICGYEDSEIRRDTDGNAWYGDKKLLEAEVLGSIRCLWDEFGGTISEKGYRLLDEHVGLIYGDSITPDLAHKILTRLKEMKFASTNVVFGVGSYTYAYMTRDTLGWAVKATWAQVNGKSVPLFKDPKTDSGVKKSLRGCVQVVDGKVIQDLTLEEFLNMWEESDFYIAFWDSGVTYQDWEYITKLAKENL